MQGGSLRALVLTMVLLAGLVPLGSAGHNPLPPPTASFIFAPQEPIAGQDIRFVDTSITNGGKTIQFADWHTSDGQFKRRAYLNNGTSPRDIWLTFATPGVYDVTLTVSDRSGHDDSTTRTITVRPGLSVDFTAAQEGATVSVAATASSPYAPISTYLWVWGDGTPNGTGARATHTYATPGDYTVRLEVVDGQGNPGRAQKVVPLVDPGLSAAIDAPAAVLAGEPAVFRDATRASPFAALSSWTWLVDGAEAGAEAALETTFDAPGWRNVTLRVVDANGVAAEANVTVRVHAAPVAQMEALLDGRDLTVNATATDADGAVVSYRWDWGDGSPPGEGPDATHAYGAAGVYLVNLTVTDDAGIRTHVTREIAVVGRGQVVAAFDASPSTAKVGQTVRFVDASVDPDGPIASWRWEFGDGATATGVSAEHAYAQGGRYVVNLTVTDSHGELTRVSQVVTVQAPPPPPPTPSTTPATAAPADPTPETPATPDAPLGTTPATPADGPARAAVTTPSDAPTTGGDAKESPGAGLVALLVAALASLLVLRRR